MTKSSTLLHVYMNGKKVGTLQQMADRGLYFRYFDDWIEAHSNFPISLRLPVREQAYSGDPVHLYFDNLLPEVKHVRERVAATAKAKSTDTFDMLSALGRDCIGALQFFETDHVSESSFKIKGDKLTNGKIAELLRNLKLQPLGISTGEDFRISLTGAQDKTAFLKKGSTWLRPDGATPTTHIFKPAIGTVNEGIDLSTSVENEWLCLNILRKFSLRTANTEIKSFEDVKVLIVERFDRDRKGQKIYRLPQEDFCQALGYATNKKYQADGGPGIKMICEALKSSNESLRDRHDFIKSQMLFFLLAATDGHAKNFSIALQPGGFELCPLYDVLSVEPAIRSGNLNRFDIKMAMKIGKPGHYRLRDIVGRHWPQMEKEIGVPKNFMKEIAGEILDEMPRVFKGFATLPKDFPESLFEDIIEGAKKRSLILATITK